MVIAHEQQEQCLAGDSGYQLTRAGRKQIENKTQGWEQMTAILARFLNPQGGLA
jgi:hypothetical protein